MPGLPTGTVTLLFTDIEGSTRLLEQLGNRYPAVLAGHRQLLRAVLKEWRGQEVDNTLALVACGQGDYRHAAALSEESLALSRESGDKGAMGRSLNVLGWVAHFQREYKQAAYLRESLTLFREMGERLGIIRCLCGLAHVAWADRFPGRAARLFGAAEGLRASIGTPFPVG